MWSFHALATPISPQPGSSVRAVLEALLGRTSGFERKASDRFWRRADLSNGLVVHRRQDRDFAGRHGRHVQNAEIRAHGFVPGKQAERCAGPPVPRAAQFHHAARGMRTPTRVDPQGGGAPRAHTAVVKAEPFGNFTAVSTGPPVGTSTWKRTAWRVSDEAFYAARGRMRLGRSGRACPSGGDKPLLHGMPVSVLRGSSRRWPLLGSLLPGMRR